MYFQQYFNGTITKIWYNTADSPYYVNVKVGAINSLQTKIVQPSAKELVLFTDPLGGILKDNFQITLFTLF